LSSTDREPPPLPLTSIAWSDEDEAPLIEILSGAQQAENDPDLKLAKLLHQVAQTPLDGDLRPVLEELIGDAVQDRS
jgi:hypothetical protein